MFSSIKSFIKNKFAYIRARFLTLEFLQKIGDRKSKLKKNGYIAILLSVATPAIIYGVKYAIDKSIFSSWNIFKKQNDEVYKKCATAIAYEVASHWNPALTLNQQIDSLQKIADETYNTYPEYHGGILGRAIAGLERIDIFDLKSLKVMQRTSMNSKFRYIKYKNASVSYYPYTILISNTANPYCALYRFADSVTNELSDSTNKNHKRPPVAIWAYERENRLPRNIISETDIFIGPSSFPKVTEKDKNGKYAPFSTLSNEGAFVFTDAIPDDSSLKVLKYSSSSSNAYFVSSDNFEKNFPVTQNNLTSMGIASVSKGGAISDNLMVADTNNSVITISLEKNDKVKIVADAIDSSDPKKQYIDKDTAYATLAKCNVDIILSIPTNEAACNNLNMDAASINSGALTSCHVTSNKQTKNAKATPIYQIAQAYRTFLKENFFYTQGVNVGLIPYSGKVSIPPHRENWATVFNAFYSNAFINDISKFPRKCKPSFRSAIFYGTKGIAKEKLYDSSQATDGKIAKSSYNWGKELTGFPIMFRMGLQSRERDTTNTALLGKNISYGGNYIYTGSILSNEDPEKGAPKAGNAGTINEPSVPASALGNKFLKMNSNPCYGGYANLLGMKCEQDCPFFLPNPYHIIELTPNVHRVFEILGVFYPFYDNKNVSNFTFIPITWANNLLATWTDGDTSKKGNTEIVSQQKKTTNGRKKVLILIVNKPDYFEPGELTYLGFNNDYAEFSGIESDKIDFTIPYNNTAYYGDDKKYSGTVTGYKRILRFEGTVAKGEGTTAEGTFFFPEKALLKIVVESKKTETEHDMTINSNGEILQIDSKKSILCNEKWSGVNGRTTIYVESNTIKNKIGNEWCVKFQCGKYVKLISGELTNSIQPPRLEWESGSKLIQSYNGKVPFTITVKAPDATIKFSPYSAAGANEYSGTYEIPYGTSKKFNFKSNQTSTTAKKQMINKFAYSPSNISMSYTVSDRKIRWKGGSGTNKWSDEGLYVTYPAHSIEFSDYVRIYMTSRFDYCPVPCWKLVVKTHWEEDKHWFFVTWYDYGCKSYKYYDYEVSSTYVNKRMYQRGEINFLLSEQITGDLSLSCSCNADKQGTLGYKEKNGNENILTIPTLPTDLPIKLSSRNFLTLYQNGDYNKDRPMLRGPKPWVSDVKFYYMAGWLLWFYPAYAAAAAIFGIAGIVSAIVYGFDLWAINILYFKYPIYNAGYNLYGAVFSVNGNIYQENIKNNGLIRFLGTGNISVTANAENNIPTFSLTKKGGANEIFSFDTRIWTPNKDDGENLFIRKKYVTSKDYDFKQLEEGGNRFDINVKLTNGAKIVSVEPDYDNVDMEEENIGEKAPTKPKQKIEWNGGNIIKTIGGQTPIKITVSPKEECKATFSVPDSIDPNKTLTSVYQIKYGATETPNIIQSNPITLGYNSKASDSKKAYKFSYNLQNTQMKYKILNRKIRWKGGDQEWSDEGVSITNSANITKGLMKNTEDKTGSETGSSTEDKTGSETRSDTDSHVICTTRKNGYHSRGRIVWQFLEKVTGTANVCWKRNPPFFPTSEELEIKDSIESKVKNLGKDDDENDVTVSIEINNFLPSETPIKFIEKKGHSKVQEQTANRTIYGQHNVAKKYVDLCTEEINEIYNKMSNEDNKKYVEKSNSFLQQIEKRLAEINNEKDQATEDKSPPRKEPPTDKDKIKIDDTLNGLYKNLDTQIAEISNSTSPYKNALCCYISTKKEKLKTLYGMKREIDRATNELENLENGQEYFDSKTGYYETKTETDPNATTAPKTQTVPNAAPSNNEKTYFPYREKHANGIKNPADGQFYTILDSLGYLQYFTLESPSTKYNSPIKAEDKNSNELESASTEYNSLIKAEDKNSNENEYKYWGVENKASSPSTARDLNVGGQGNNINAITLSGKDMFAVFQKESYLSGHRFYYMEFTEDQNQAHIKNFMNACDVELPTSRKTSTTEKIEDQTVTTDKYANTDIYTKTTEINSIKNLSIIDENRKITRNEITDTSSGVMTYTISGSIEFCGTGDVSVELKGAPKPYAYIKKLENVGAVTEKFEFDTYHALDPITKKPINVYKVDANGNETNEVEKDEDGNDKYEVAKKSIYIDPYTYKYEPVTGEANTYQINIELSNAVINTVEVMSDELAHPELSSHSRIVDGTTGKVQSSGGEDDTKHEENLKIEGNEYTRLTNSAMVHTKDRTSTKMYILNFPGDANLSFDDTGVFTGSGDSNIGEQKFIGGMVNYETYAPGEIRKFFPLWRKSTYQYVTTSSTTASTNLKMCEFSYPMNSVLLFGQQSLSLEDESFYSYKWQDPARAKTDSREVYDQASALKYVVRDACEKLKQDYGGDKNVRVYVIKYRAQTSYNSIPYYKDAKVCAHDYSEIEKCASPSTFLGMNLGGKYSYNANNESDLKKALSEIADDIKKFATYENVQCFDTLDKNE